MDFIWHEFLKTLLSKSNFFFFFLNILLYVLYLTYDTNHNNLLK